MRRSLFLVIDAHVEPRGTLALGARDGNIRTLDWLGIDFCRGRERNFLIILLLVHVCRGRGRSFFLVVWLVPAVGSHRVLKFLGIEL
jgi:hypothetical protein